MKRRLKLNFVVFVGGMMVGGILAIILYAILLSGKEADENIEN